MMQGEYLAGRLLLAMPGMGDPRFDRAVIAMTQHDENGAFGVDIGHRHDTATLDAVFAELGLDARDAPPATVLHGGPVEPGRGFVLHSLDWGGTATMEVRPIGALSASLDVLRAIGGVKGPRHWLFVLGYAGWGAGQLEGEMRRHGWYAAQGHPDVVFETAPEARWAAAWRAEGIDPALLANVTGRA